MSFLIWAVRIWEQIGPKGQVGSSRSIIPVTHSLSNVLLCLCPQRHGATWMPRGDTDSQRVPPLHSDTHPRGVTRIHPSPHNRTQTAYLLRVDRVNRTTLFLWGQGVGRLCSVCPLARPSLVLVFSEASLESQVLEEGWRMGRQREWWACLRPDRCHPLLPPGPWGLSPLTETCQVSAAALGAVSG